MKIVDINDIEDIILAKYEIDKNDPECETRSNLAEFMSKYCTLTDVLVIDGQLLSFKYVELFNHTYLFISDKNQLNEISNFLSLINYNIDNLKEIPMTELMINSDKYLIHNNKYYRP